VTVVHDAIPHPGDLRSLIASLATPTFSASDLVITLSAHVANRLKAKGLVRAGGVRQLFLPEVRLRAAEPPTFPVVAEPLRILFLGRILPYKGLDLLIDAVKRLRREGIALHLGVFGEGPLGRSGERLRTLGAEVVNRWLAADEMARVLARYHAVVLSHTEASQSGVASLALGHGLPVVATPVGGLLEQIDHGVTGIIAERVDAAALAVAISHLAQDPTCYANLVAGIRRSQEGRSTGTFLEGLARHVSELSASRKIAEKRTSEHSSQPFPNQP